LAAPPDNPPLRDSFGKRQTIPLLTPVNQVTLAERELEETC
jgi:hypothetical protein